MRTSRYAARFRKAMASYSLPVPARSRTARSAQSRFARAAVGTRLATRVRDSLSARRRCACSCVRLMAEPHAIRCSMPWRRIRAQPQARDLLAYVYESAAPVATVAEPRVDRARVRRWRRAQREQDRPSGGARTLRTRPRGLPFSGSRRDRAAARVRRRPTATQRRLVVPDRNANRRRPSVSARRQRCRRAAPRGLDAGSNVAAECVARVNGDLPPTERGNPQTSGLDLLDTRTLVDVLVGDQLDAVEAVRSRAEVLARIVDAVAECLERGGRLHYVGAGSSGRLATLDAAEMPPTFGTNPEMVCAHVAGGFDALVRAVEGAEDDRDAGAAAMSGHVAAGDVAIGISASGSAAFVIGAIERAREIGARTFALVNAEGSELARVAGDGIVLPTGAEALAGSTRLKAGTAQKIALNAISTAVMVRLGKGSRQPDGRSGGRKQQASYPCDAIGLYARRRRRSPCAGAAGAGPGTRKSCRRHGAAARGRGRRMEIARRAPRRFTLAFVILRRAAACEHRLRAAGRPSRNGAAAGDARPNCGRAGSDAAGALSRIALQSRRPRRGRSLAQPRNEEPRRRGVRGLGRHARVRRVDRVARARRLIRRCAFAARATARDARRTRRRLDRCVRYGDAFGADRNAGNRRIFCRLSRLDVPAAVCEPARSPLTG